MTICWYLIYTVVFRLQPIVAVMADKKNQPDTFMFTSNINNKHRDFTQEGKLQSLEDMGAEWWRVVRQRQCTYYPPPFWFQQDHP